MLQINKNDTNKINTLVEFICRKRYVIMTTVNKSIVFNVSQRNNDIT